MVRRENATAAGDGTQATPSVRVVARMAGPRLAAIGALARMLPFPLRGPLCACSWPRSNAAGRGEWPWADSRAAAPLGEGHPGGRSQVGFIQDGSGYMSKKTRNAFFRETLIGRPFRAGSV